VQLISQHAESNLSKHR